MFKKESAMTLWRLVFQQYRIELVGLAILSLISALASVGVIAFINSALIVADGGKELSLNRHRAKILYSDDYLNNAQIIRRFIIRGDTYHLTALNWSDTMMLASIGMVFYLANVMHWSDNITATTFAITILFLKSPLIQTVGLIPVLIDAHVSFKKVMALQLNKSDHIELNNPKIDFAIQVPSVAEIQWQKIELQDIRYQYTDIAGKPSFAIGPINLTLHRGDVVFLIGGNGSGKSTFAKIITGLYRPDSGQILIDDKAVTNTDDDYDTSTSKTDSYNTIKYRQLYSAIYTDLHLFKNVIGQQDKLTNDEQKLMQEWLALLGMKDKLSIDDNGKVLNEDLSQGQKKRLAMLLAVMEQRDLLLLDEWAADQDPQFRRIFYFDIIPKLKAMGKTLIVISHDDHYFEQADRLLQMKNGVLHELTGKERIAASRDAIATVTSVEV